MPALIGIDRVPTSDELKHFGAALASYGSVALFHMIGITPEAQRLATSPIPSLRAERDDRRGRSARVPGSLRAGGRHGRCRGVLRAAAQPAGDARSRRHAGRPTHATIPLLVVTSPQVKPDADRMGLTARIEAAGGLVLSGMCFYQSYAREMAEANGWQTLVTNSAKLVNILGGYGYRPALLVDAGTASMRRAPGRIAMTELRCRRRDGHARARPCAGGEGRFLARATISTASAGVFSRPEHKLAGQSYVGRILVLDAAKGGVATAWMLHEMAARGVMPAALVLNRSTRSWCRARRSPTSP